MDIEKQLRVLTQTDGHKFKQIEQMWLAYVNRTDMPPEATPKEVFFAVVGALFDEHETMRRKLGRRSQALAKARARLLTLGVLDPPHPKMKCQHDGSRIVNSDHTECGLCGAVLTRVRGWNLWAQQKWFPTYGVAKFFNQRGYYPDDKEKA